MRQFALLLVLALVAAGTHYLPRLLPAPTAAPAPPPAPVIARAPEAPESAALGPHWPPTDEEWLAEFTHTAWAYPLPGPARRHPSVSRDLFVADARSARCRRPGRCGVDVGGELWGEHVYAAHDGVIDRVSRAEDAPGGSYVRIAHWGGAVFTQYFHLAAIPTHLAAGMHVEAGEVIGLAGDTGLADPRAHLHFTLSVRPSSDSVEVYWDPSPLMASWPLRTPERGSVAGLVSAEAPAERIAGAPSEPRRPPPRPAKHRQPGKVTAAN